MFKLKHLKGNTYYLACYSNCGVFDLGNGEAILIDSCDHKKSVMDLDKHLESMGLKVKAIYNTHGHIDHITGNEYFRDKYGCKVYAHGIERAFAQTPTIEGVYFYHGTDVPRIDKGFTRHIALNGEETYFNVETEFLTENVLEPGFEMLELPGHTFDMVGIKTPDDVWFLGDSILDPELFESYRLPLFMFPSSAAKTCRTTLKELKGSAFVPSHLPPMENIDAVCDANAEGIDRLLDYIESLCAGRSAEEILQAMDREFDLKMTQDRYAKMFTMTRACITDLIRLGRVKAEISDGKMVYSV